MTTTPDGLVRSELEAVGATTDDPALRALEVAIYLEDALGIVLPDDVLDEGHLGSPEAVAATLAAVRPGS